MGIQSITIKKFSDDMFDFSYEVAGENNPLRLEDQRSDVVRFMDEATDCILLETNKMNVRYSKEKLKVLINAGDRDGSTDR